MNKKKSESVKRRARKEKQRLRVRPSAIGVIAGLVILALLLSIPLRVIFYREDLSHGITTLSSFSSRNEKESAAEVRKARTLDVRHRMEEDDLTLGDLLGDRAIVGGEIVYGFEAYGLLRSTDVCSAADTTIEQAEIWDEHLRLIHPDGIIFAFDRADLELEISPKQIESTDLTSTSASSDSSQGAVSDENQTASNHFVQSQAVSVSEQESSASDDLDDSSDSEASSGAKISDSQAAELFCELLEQKINHISTDLPSCRFVINSFFDPYSPASYTSQEQKRMDLYNEALKKVCEERGWVYIDNSRLAGTAGPESRALDETFYEQWLQNMVCFIDDLDPWPLEDSSSK